MTRRQQVLASSAATAAVGGVIWSGSTVLNLLTLAAIAVAGQAAFRRMVRDGAIPRWRGWGSDLLWASVLVVAGDLLGALYITGPRAMSVEITIEWAGTVGIAVGGAVLSSAALYATLSHRSRSAPGLDGGQS